MLFMIFRKILFCLILDYSRFTMRMLYWFQIYLQVVHTHIATVFQILFPFRLLQNIEESSLCCTVSPCYLFVLYVACVFVNPKLLIYSPPPPFSSGNHMVVF